MKNRHLLILIMDLALTHAALVGVSWAGFLTDTPLEGIGMTLLAVPYFLHQIGLPVLSSIGQSGGWPSPNIFGWASAFGFWIALYGGLAWQVWRGRGGRGPLSENE